MRGRRRKRGRIYWRGRGAKKRAWGNFADYADVGGGREALVPAGSKLATTDSVLAETLAAERLRELESARRGKILTGVAHEATLSQFAEYHLMAKANAANVTYEWVARSERYLQAAVDHFGADRMLGSIGVRDIEGWIQSLASKRGRRGRAGLSNGSIRHYLNALSNLYRRAAGEGYVLPGYNPVAAVMDKPTVGREEARWLEIHEAALLLEASRSHQKSRKDGLPFMYPLVATFLLTGGRQAEVLGLEVDDVSFDRRTITFRPNDWRRLKTRTSHRSVPLWPQLEEILREHVYGGESPRVSGLLFPSARPGAGMVTDLRKAMDAMAERLGWSAGELRTKMFRHTYCAARLQTLDRGAAVSVYTVAKELGHGGDALVKRVYGHIGEVRHRSDVVEYRTDQHIARLKAEASVADKDPRRKSEAGRLRAAIEQYRGQVRALLASQRAHRAAPPGQSAV